MEAIPIDNKRNEALARFLGYLEEALDSKDRNLKISSCTISRMITIANHQKPVMQNLENFLAVVNHPSKHSDSVVDIYKKDLRQFKFEMIKLYRAKFKKVQHLVEESELQKVRIKIGEYHLLDFIPESNHNTALKES